MSSSLINLICYGPQDLYTQGAIDKLKSFYRATDDNKEQFAEHRKHLTDLFSKISQSYITSGLIEDDCNNFPSALDEFDKTYAEYIKQYNLPDLEEISFFKVVYPSHQEDHNNRKSKHEYEEKPRQREKYRQNKRY